MRFQCCLTLDLTASLAAPAAFGAQAVGVPISPFARSRWQPWLAGMPHSTAISTGADHQVL